MLSHNAETLNTSHAYDRRGNLIREYENNALTKTYDFNLQGMLERTVIHPETELQKKINYIYNFMGQRVSKKSDLEEIRYLTDITRDHSNLLKETVNGKERTYTYDAAVVSFSTGKENFYYQTDELGSTMYLTGTDGASYSPYAYDPFGNRLDPKTGRRKGYSVDGNIIQPFAFTGYREEENGLYYAQARSYDSRSGRFTGEDRVRGMLVFPETQNHYIYCWNAPLGLVDNNGLFPTALAGAIGGGIIGGISYSVGAAISGDFSWKGLAASSAGGAATGALMCSGVTDPRILGAAYAGTSAFVTGAIDTAQAVYEVKKSGGSLGDMAKTAAVGLGTTAVSTVANAGIGAIGGGLFSGVGKLGAMGVGAATRGGAALIDELRDDKKGVNLGRVARNSLAGAAEAYTAMTMFAGLKVGIDQGGTGTQIAKTSLKAMKGNIRSDIKALKYGAIRAIARLLPGMGSPAPVDVMCAGENGSGKRFKYEHNPSDNPKVLEDAIEDPDAVYGYRPREDGSLSRFTAKKYDWTDPVAVEGYRQERIEYHNRNEAGAQRIVKEMTAAGASIEDIAIKVNEYRNQSRIDAFVNPDGSISDMNGYNNALERAQIRSYENLIKAGKSPEEIIKSAIKGCPGMDACTGLYDEYYDTY